MDLVTLKELFDYNRWANARTLDAAAAVAPADFAREVGGSFASLHGTLAHLCGAEWVWLERLRGTSPSSLPFASELTDIAAIRRRWNEVERGQRVFLDGLDADRLGESLSYVNFAGEPNTYPIWRVLAHVVNHSTYHRGQVTTLLRQLGGKPVSTDLLRFYDANPTR